ncbi:uncharacterized protein [Clytia hemisphaerica]|uniref:Potassium channel domain-containing protein n=1 Tax=Clytia hemisphaerica TaxID=252671 RepID=A0A7M5X7N0_9CNID
MRVTFVIFILLLKYRQIDGSTTPATQNGSVIQQVLQLCTIRYSMLSQFKDLVGCDEVRTLNPLCGRNLTVASSFMPPYVYQDNEKISGILPALLKEIIVDVCCLGCNTLHYLPQKGFIEKYAEQVNKPVDIVIPVQNHINRKTFFNAPYQTLMFVRDISMFGKKVHNPPKDIMSSLFWSMLRTWPLLLMALSMAMAAGCIIWLLDTWTNKRQFPRTLPYGPFEGLWWSFVSMTTVGYGDRTPTSTLARSFAILWIFVGISLFNMYTGTITSVITSELQKTIPFSVYGHRIGVLENVTAPNSTTIMAGGNPIVYKNITSLKNALQNEEIKAIAMESSMMQYYQKDLDDLGSEYFVQLKLEASENGIGFMALDPQLAKMTRNFYEENQDNIYTFWHESHKRYLGIESTLDFHEENSESTQTTIHGKEIFTPNHITFPITIAFTVVVSLACIVVAQLTDRRVQQRKKSMTSQQSSQRSRNGFPPKETENCNNCKEMTVQYKI